MIRTFDLKKINSEKINFLHLVFGAIKWSFNELEFGTKEVNNKQALCAMFLHCSKHK